MENVKPELVDRALQVHLAEFEVLRDEINVHIGVQNTCVNYAIAIVGATVALFALEASAILDQRSFLLLICSILLSSISLAMVDASYSLNDIGSYLNSFIAPRIQKLIGESTMPEYEVLRWESSRIYEGPRIVSKAILSLGKFFVAYIPSVVFIFAYLSLKTSPIQSWIVIEKILFFTSIAVVLIALLSGVLNISFVVRRGSRSFPMSDDLKLNVSTREEE